MAEAANGKSGDMRSTFLGVYADLKSELLQDPAFDFTEDSREWIEKVELLILASGFPFFTPAFALSLSNLRVCALWSFVYFVYLFLMFTISIFVSIRLER